MSKRFLVGPAKITPGNLTMLRFLYRD